MYGHYDLSLSLNNENVPMTTIYSRPFNSQNQTNLNGFTEIQSRPKFTIIFHVFFPNQDSVSNRGNFHFFKVVRAEFAEFAHSICRIQKPVLNGKFPYFTFLAFKINILLRVLHSQFRVDNSFGQTNSILQGMIIFYLRVPPQISTTYTFKAFTTVRH